MADELESQVRIGAGDDDDLVRPAVVLEVAQVDSPAFAGFADGDGRTADRALQRNRLFGVDGADAEVPIQRSEVELVRALALIHFYADVERALHSQAGEVDLFG